MKDPYQSFNKSLNATFKTLIDMICWLAQRTLSVKEYSEFVDKFSEKTDGSTELD